MKKPKNYENFTDEQKKLYLLEHLAKKQSEIASDMRFIFYVVAIGVFIWVANLLYALVS